MDIKIPSAPLEGGAIESAKEATESAESTAPASDVSGAGLAETDTISSIAEQVARGEIGQTEAIDQILRDILESGMVDAAPAELKQELKEALESLLETDPTLKSLSTAISPGKTE